MRNLTIELQLRLRTREALGQRSALEITLTLLMTPKLSGGVMYVVNVAVIDGCKASPWLKVRTQQPNTLYSLQATQMRLSQSVEYR